MPSDMNCIFSTLKFVSNLAYSLGTPTIITFDQPLFWNASKIMQNPANPVVKKIMVKLGTFRTDMNLLLCHWYDHGKHWLKKCVKNDIQRELCITYSKRESCIPSAKKSLRYSSMSVYFNSRKIYLYSRRYNTEFELDNLCSSLKNGQISLEDVDANNTLQFLRMNLKKQVQNLTTASRTAPLWLSYQYLLDLVQSFIQADRLGF